MGKRGIFQQFNYALNENFEEGRDKHAEKANDSETTEKIYSYSSLNNLKDFAKNLSNYFKENNPSIKQIGDIKSSDLQNFLNDKNEKGCSQNTLDLYKSNITKMEQVVNKTFKSVDWDTSDVKTPASIKEYDTNRGANSVINKADYDKLIEYFQNNRSESGDAIILQNTIGVRVEELAQLRIKSVDLANNKLNLTNTKGGRPITKEIQDDIKNIIKEHMVDKDGNQKGFNDKLFDVKSGSINKQLNRIEDKLGLERHSTHDLRRYVAQAFYDNCRDNGDSKDVALLKTSQFLGHNTARQRMMTKSYIKIW